MWKTSAERILLAMTYGEFADVVNAEDNTHVAGLLQMNAVLEMDGLSSNTDRKMFSEALMLYLYRHKLAEGASDRLNNVIVLEEAHNLLLAQPAGSRESVLENSIRTVRELGLGYIFVDQSASLLSRVAFSNSYATIALSQKMQADVRAMTAAMNLSDEQKQSLSTLPVGSAVVRLADEHPEPFLVQIRPADLRDDAVGDDEVRQSTAGLTSVGDHTDSTSISSTERPPPEITAVPTADKKKETKTQNPESLESSDPGEAPPQTQSPRPPPLYPEQGEPSQAMGDSEAMASSGGPATSGGPTMSRESIRFLADVGHQPLTTTVQRYERLKLSRRRGNAIRQQLIAAGLIESTAVATRSGQVVLVELTDAGVTLAERLGLDPRPRPVASLEHRYWVSRAARHFERQGYELTREYQVADNGAIDLLAVSETERVQIEVETGKSDIGENLTKAVHGGFDRIVVIATSPAAATACHRAMSGLTDAQRRCVELLTWLDID
jgi:hypothetical protein